MRLGLTRTLAISAGVLMLSSLPAAAQATACKTSNCAAGNPGSPVFPAECKAANGEDIAAPRVITVNMTNSPSFQFQPSSIRIEGRHPTAGTPWPYQCIRWHKLGSAPWHSATEDTAGNTCNTATACSSANAYPDPCSFETGNVDTATLEWSVCHYKDIAPAVYSYRCRLHAGFGMTGQLTVVNPIELRVSRTVGMDAQLTWTNGGSASGPWDVFRDNTASAQKMHSAVRLSAAAGHTTRTFTDTTCAPAAGGLCAYMIRECNVFGGSCI